MDENVVCGMKLGTKLEQPTLHLGSTPRSSHEMAPAAQSTQKKDWCFTFNNYDEELLTRLSSVLSGEHV